MTRARPSAMRRNATPRTRGTGTVPMQSRARAATAARSGRSSGAGRIAGLDALRGIAIVAMIAYHFCFDLRYFHVTRFDLEHDVGWLAARALILSSFLLIAGVSAALAARMPRPTVHALRHVGTIAAAALLVTAASAAMFPQSFIWFGVLHAIAVSLLIAQPLVRRPALAALAGVIVIAAGVAYANPAFDNRWLGWLGFMTAKPITEDYVPLFPWTGVLLLGVALGHLLMRSGFAALAPLATLPSWLRFLGRHSLVAYLVHQPLLLGALALAIG
jgi:uncharacterized membrane protein